jgi:Tol biopolymer transport system component
MTHRFRTPSLIAGSALCAALALLLALPAAAVQSDSATESLSTPREVHLGQLRQLTFGGENAEAYWAPDGSELIFQSTRPPLACDQIFRLPVDHDTGEPGEATMVSTGKGRTTCAYFTFPRADRILYASTHEASAECPPTPDRSQGYVWPLYDEYEIYSALTDGSDLQALTDNESYDAEATVCPLDGSIVFTSTRDGDLDLYRMDADGTNVLRLTDTPGYDGGAFFSADCTQIVWRASRPREGKELDDYRRLLSQGLVRPSQLEIWVADADGTDARQVTYLGAASFAPYFFPDGKRIVFSSNYGDPQGREFEIWAINVDGTGLEQITFSEGFDGFPIFSPDGRWLAFSSNRHNAAPHDTNVFVARWLADGAGQATETAADRFLADVAWLADDAREGRGVGTAGLEASGDWLAMRFAEIGLEPAGADGGYRQPFEVTAAIEVGAATALSIAGQPVAADQFRPAAFSTSGSVRGEVVPVGYGIVSEEHGLDDYAGLDVTGKIALVRRFTPDGPPFDDEDVQRQLSGLRHKAFTAREKGAIGVLMVDLPASVPEGEEMPEEAPLPSLAVDLGGEAGLPVATLTRAAGEPLFAGGQVAELTVELVPRKEQAFNVVGRLPAAAGSPQQGAVLVGAHYDHLGHGGPGSLDPDADAPHNGADDNASGTAALLEAARQLAAQRNELQRDVYFVAFSGEESGLLGSTYLTRNPPAGLDVEGLEAMVNMDMVGRMRDNRLSVLGTDSAQEWEAMVAPLCDAARVVCQMSGDGYGPSDQTPFYAAGVPVLHFFTGVHDDYHKPSDDTERINAGGGAQVAALAAEVTAELAALPSPLTFKAAPAPPPRGDTRSYGASLGTVPDYAGPPEGVEGVLLSGVRPGSPAEEAGIRRGDLLVELAGKKIGDIYDFVYILRDAKPGQKSTAVVERGGKRVELVITFGVSRGIR